MRWLSRQLLTIVSLGVSDECDDDMRTNRRVFTGASLFVCIAGPIWGAMYIAFGELGPGLIPTIYSAITLASFIALWRRSGRSGAGGPVRPGSGSPPFSWVPSSAVSWTRTCGIPTTFPKH